MLPCAAVQSSDQPHLSSRPLPVVVVILIRTSSSQPLRTGRTVRTGLARLDRASYLPLGPSLQGAGPIEALDSYYAAQDAAQAAEQRERERVVPLSRLARERPVCQWSAPTRAGRHDDAGPVSPT